MEPQSPATSPTPTKTSVESVPSAWPGAFGIFKHSRKAVQLNIWSILGIGLLYVLISAILGNLGAEKGAGVHRSTGPGSLVASLIGVFLDVAITFVLLAGVRGAKMSIGEALKKSLPLYGKALLLNILTVIISVVTLLLLIVPFFIVMPRLELAMYFLIDKKLGPIEALKASWRATKGNVGKVWGIYGAGFVMALLILVLIGVYLVIMYLAAFAVLYVYLTDGESASVPVEAAETDASSAPAAQ